MTLVAETRPAARRPSPPSAPASPPRRDRRRTRDIQINDRFSKVAELLEAAQTVWVVWHLVELPGLPTHVKLIQESDPERVITVALAALSDRRLYRRLDPVSAPPSDEQRAVLGAAGAIDATSLSGGDGAARSRSAGGDNLVPFLRSGRKATGAAEDDRFDGEGTPR